MARRKFCLFILSAISFILVLGHKDGGPEPAACSVPPDRDRDPVFYLETADGAPLRPGAGRFRPHMIFKPLFLPPAFQPGEHRDQGQRRQHPVENERMRRGPLGVQLPAQTAPDQERQEPGLHQQFECQQEQGQGQKQHTDLNNKFHAENLLYFGIYIISYLKNLVKKSVSGMIEKT